jgi:FKBP-type peptidyl-prolyl cis-trans isomerase
MILLPLACSAPVQEEYQPGEPDYKKSFVETNQYMRARHRDHMIAFMQRVGWEMTESPTGLWYAILREGNGDAVEKDRFIRYAYETRLITGKLCYSADTTAPKSIVVGKGNIEAGLEEGLLKLRENSKARFLIPPYLAHGNFGDGNKIPGSSILIVEVEVLEVKR